MFPVFKSGDKHSVKNYRGITSLSAGSKLFEIVVNKALLDAAKGYISADQHGFVPGRSVVTNLLSFTSSCINNLERKLQVDAVYTDLKAAFDRIDHNILLAKFKRLGATERLTQWLRSYLTDRVLSVTVGSCTSLPFLNSSGVPQGSNLGPSLFLVSYNDAPLALGPDSCLVYADDLKLYSTIRTVEDCRRLQELVDTFLNWCRCNFMVVSKGLFTQNHFDFSQQSTV